MIVMAAVDSHRGRVRGVQFRGWSIPLQKVLDIRLTVRFKQSNIRGSVI